MGSGAVGCLDLSDGVINCNDMRHETEFRWLLCWHRELGENGNGDVFLHCVATRSEQIKLKYSTWPGEDKLQEQNHLEIGLDNV